MPVKKKKATKSPTPEQTPGKTFKDTETPKTEVTEPEKPRLYTADIKVSGKLVSSVSLKAGSKGAAQIAAFRLIKVEIKK